MGEVAKHNAQDQRTGPPMVTVNLPERATSGRVGRLGRESLRQGFAFTELPMLLQPSGNLAKMSRRNEAAGIAPASVEGEAILMKRL